MAFPGTKYTLADSNPIEIPIGNNNQMLAWCVNPESGDTVRVRYKTTGSADWETYGSYTSFHSDHVVAPIYAMEVQRTAGTGTTSFFEIA